MSVLVFREISEKERERLMEIWGNFEIGSLSERRYRYVEGLNKLQFNDCFCMHEITAETAEQSWAVVRPCDQAEGGLGANCSHNRDFERELPDYENEFSRPFNSVKLFDSIKGFCCENNIGACADLFLQLEYCFDSLSAVDDIMHRAQLCRKSDEETARTWDFDANRQQTHSEIIDDSFKLLSKTTNVTAVEGVFQCRDNYVCFEPGNFSLFCSNMSLIHASINGKLRTIRDEMVKVLEGLQF